MHTYFFRFYYSNWNHRTYEHHTQLYKQNQTTYLRTNLTKTFIRFKISTVRNKTYFNQLKKKPKLTYIRQNTREAHKTTLPLQHWEGWITRSIEYNFPYITTTHMVIQLWRTCKQTTWFFNRNYFSVILSFLTYTKR